MQSEATFPFPTLGDAWIVPKTRWKGYAPPYTPAFADGWRPNPMLYYDQEDRIKQISSHLSTSASEVARYAQRERPVSDGLHYDVEFDGRSSVSGPTGSVTESSSPLNGEGNAFRSGNRRLLGSGGAPSPRSSLPSPHSSIGGGGGGLSPPHSQRQRVSSEYPPPRRPSTTERRDEEAELDARLSALVFEDLRHDSRLLRAFANRMQLFEEHLLHRGCRVYEAIFDRRSNHVKEITVRKSEVLEVIDAAKQWWKVRNWRGEEGYAPNTILKMVHDSVAAAPSILPPPPPPLPPPALKESTTSLPDARGSVGHAAAVLAARGQLRSIQATGAAAKNLRSPPSKRESLSSALNDELKLRMSHGRGSGQPPVLDLASDNQKSNGAAVAIYLSQESSEEEVQKWLVTKGFSQRVQQALQGQTGLSLFTLKQNEFIEFFGKEEGTRLDSQLTVQKNLCGYSTISSYELRAILNHRKSQVEKAASDDKDRSARVNNNNNSSNNISSNSGLEAPPDFDPPTPQPSIDGGSIASGQFAL